MTCPEACKVELNKKVNRLTIQWGVGLFVMLFIFIGGLTLNAWSTEVSKRQAVKENQIAVQKDVEYIKKAVDENSEQMKMINAAQHEVLEALIKINQTIQRLHP